MAGGTCQNCIWTQWSDKKQIGCALNRIDHYEKCTIFDTITRESFFVTPNNICPAKRDKEWIDLVNFAEGNPIDVVSKELYPRVQLLIFDQTESLDEGLFDKFHSVTAIIKDGCAVSRPSHKKFTVTYTRMTPPECINYFVDKKANFIYTANADNINYDLPDILDNYLNRQCKQICMVCSMAERGYNSFLYSVDMFKMVGFFNELTVEDTGNYLKDKGLTHLIVGSIEELRGK